MGNKVEVSEKEKAKFDEIRNLYNSGEAKRAVEESNKFIEEFPHSYLARYNYAVMSGDYSYSAELSADEQKKFREIGNNGIKGLFEDPEFSQWPKDFQFRVRNEYYWFFELHQKQYELGLEKIALGEKGDYSACVGACMMAFKTLEQKNISLAEEWANKSLKHFHAFEAYAPHWHNINYFSARSLACLGKYDEALKSFKDMFRKQAGPINDAEVEKFLDQMQKIKALRGQ